jgi:hypothetical protein
MSPVEMKFGKPGMISVRTDSSQFDQEDYCDSHPADSTIFRWMVCCVDSHNAQKQAQEEQAKSGQ